MALIGTNRAKSAQDLRHRVASRPRGYDPLLDDGFAEPTEADLAKLPDPAPLLPAIATLVVEVIAGARSLEQLASLVSDQVYERLRTKVQQNAMAQGDRPRLMPKVGKLSKVPSTVSAPTT